MADHTLSEPFTPTDSIAPTVSLQLLPSLFKIISIKIPILYSFIVSSYLVLKFRIMTTHVSHTRGPPIHPTVLWVPEAVAPQVKWPGYEVDYSTPSRDKVNL